MILYVCCFGHWPAHRCKSGRRCLGVPGVLRLSASAHLDAQLHRRHWLCILLLQANTLFLKLASQLSFSKCASTSPQSVSLFDNAQFLELTSLSGPRSYHAHLAVCCPVRLWLRLTLRLCGCRLSRGILWGFLWGLRQFWHRRYPCLDRARAQGRLKAPQWNVRRLRHTHLNQCSCNTCLSDDNSALCGVPLCPSALNAPLQGRSAERYGQRYSRKTDMSAALTALLQPLPRCVHVSIDIRCETAPAKSADIPVKWAPASVAAPRAPAGQVPAAAAAGSCAPAPGPAHAPRLPCGHAQHALLPPPDAGHIITFQIKGECRVFLLLGFCSSRIAASGQISVCSIWMTCCTTKPYRDMQVNRRCTQQINPAARGLCMYVLNNTVMNCLDA